MASLAVRRITAILLACDSLAGCAAQHRPAEVAAQPSAAPVPAPPDLNALYAAAIADAAVKRPAFVADLTPIDSRSGDVQLISMHREDPSPINAKTGTNAQPVWAALPRELEAKCRSRHGDPSLVLREILGLPPDDTAAPGGAWRLSLFNVSTKRVFRPCASSPDISTKSCSLQIAKANGSQADFVYHKMWSAYRIGAETSGYPFTGMGWTYDWGPDATSRIGVSEYVVRAGSRIGKLQTLTPAAFCAGPEVPLEPVTPPPAPSSATPAPPSR